MNPFYGIYRGVCVNNEDPMGANRITALVPQVFGNTMTATGWAYPCVPPTGTWTPPVPGDGVWIAFEGGDIEHPIWLGVW